MRLQGNQKGPLEQKAAFGIVLIVLDRRFHGGGMQSIRL